jgi:hypothetical protein
MIPNIVPFENRSWETKKSISSSSKESIFDALQELNIHKKERIQEIIKDNR